MSTPSLDSCVAIGGNVWRLDECSAAHRRAAPNLRGDVAPLDPGSVNADASANQQVSQFDRFPC